MHLVSTLPFRPHHTHRHFQKGLTNSSLYCSLSEVFLNNAGKKKQSTTNTTTKTTATATAATTEWLVVAVQIHHRNTGRRSIGKVSFLALPRWEVVRPRTA